MANQLTNYLANFKSEKNGNITHTRIGDKKLNIYGGSYNIDDKNHLEFMELYYNWVILAGNDEYLTEKQDKDEGVIALDFDFRYDTSIKTRQHSEDHILDMLCLYMDKLNELCDIPDTTINAYVMHKPNTNCLENKTKDGIHIIIDAKLNRNAQKIMRLMLIENLKQLWEDLPITNDWNDVVDEGVVNASVNWQLYGSHKPHNETYKLTSKYEFKLQDDGFEPKKVEINNALSFDEFLKLSLQSGGETILQVKDEHKQGIEKHFKQTNKTNTGLLTPPPEQNNNKNIKNDEYLDLLFNVIGNGYSNGVKCVSYHQRLTIRFVLKSNGYDKQHYIDYCNLREGKGKDNAEDDWEKLSIKEVSPLGLLDGLAKKINPSGYKNWNKTREDKIKEIGKKMLMENIKKSENNKSYEKVKEEFEKTHSLIVNKSLFIKETEDDVIFMKESQLKTSYKYIKYSEPAFNKNGEMIGMKDECFILKWLYDENIKKYETIGVYPPPLKCPSYVFNLWKPFAISKYTDEYVKDEEGLEMFKNHVKILCGNDENVTDYIIKWIGQMFQYPAVKTNVPTFISGEGAGKGSLLELLSHMMGTGKTLITTQPSRDVWGSFNGLMSNCFLVNLNEMSKKETTDAEGKIKGLITDLQLTINKKGIDPYLINSYNRFITTTNSEDPIKTKKGDRRNIIIRSSDEKCGNKQYFKDLIAKFKDINVMRTIYDYLMSIKDLDKFGEIPVPETEYHNDMKEQNRSYYDRWLESYITDYQNEDVEYFKLLGESQYKLFNDWCSKNGIKYETNSPKMALGIKRLNIKGIITGFRTSKGNETHYHKETLKKHYKIGCMIEL